MAPGEQSRKLLCLCGKPLGTFDAQGLLLGDNDICAVTTITPEHPNGRGDGSYLADTPGLRGIQPGANDGRASEEAHGRDASAW
jgi:hypothetical protein